MLTTAKSIQLLDASGMNISPITDITSLYYEVANPNNQGIISRKYIYDEFPVGVDINPNTEVSIGTSTGEGSRHLTLYSDGQLYKIVDVNKNNVKEDILVSNVSTYIMKGTTLREIKVKNYNLSEILSYYTPLDLMDASCHALDISINNINSSIRDVSTRIANISSGLNAESCTLYQLINLKGNLVPNKFYLINDYYADGCMALPNSDSENFSGPDSSLSLLVKASDATNLDGKLYEMYSHSGNALKVYGTYKLEDNNTKVRITYMKDQYGNEAPYDFYNLTYNNKYTFDRFSHNTLLDNNKDIANNIIKTDPYTFYNMPVFFQNGHQDAYIIKNNYIGFDNDINIEIYSDINIQNNIIYNQNNIKIKLNNIIFLYNFIICDNNSIGITGTTLNNNNGNIGNNNNIKLVATTLTNLNINSSNNITLYNNASNVIILNNCNASINLSDNIIVDNYITATNSSLNTTSNSVYLFGQDVYAKSFNTLR